MGVEAEDVRILGVGLVHGDLGHAHPVLLAGADGHGAAVLDVDDRVRSDPVLHRPAEEHVLDFPFARLALAGVSGALVGGLRGLQVGGGADGVDRRALDDDAAVDQRFEVHEAVVLVLGEAVDAGHADHPQVLAAGEDGQDALLEIGRAHHLQVVGGHQFRGLPVQGPVDHHRPAEGGDAVAAVGPVVGLGQACAQGRAARVVVLEDDRRRPVGEVLDDVQAVVHVGEIDLARVFAHLEHVRGGDGAHQPLARVDEAAVAENQVAVDQFIEGRLLVRVLAVTQSAFLGGAVLLGDFPGFLAVDQGLVTEGDGHLHGEGVAEQGRIHFFQVGHGGNAPLG